MALDIVDDPNKPKDPNAVQDSQSPQPGTSTSSGTNVAQGAGEGGPSTSTSNAGNSAPSGTGGNPNGGGNTNRAGSGFVNIQNILNANRNNQLGNTVGSGIQNVSKGVNTGLQNSQQQFQEQSQAGTVGSAADIQARNDILHRISGYQAPGSASNNGTVNAGGNASFNEAAPMSLSEQNSAVQGAPPASEPSLVSDQDVSNFGKYQAGQYTGPQGLNDLTGLQSSAQKAQEYGQNTNTVGGQQNLLQNFVAKRPGYDRGKSALDALILGQTGQDQLQQAKQSTFGLVDKVNQAGNSASETAGQDTELSKKFGQETKDMLGGIGSLSQDYTKNTGAIGNLANNLYNKLQVKNNAAADEYNAFQNRLTNKQLTQADIQKYFSPFTGNSPYGEASTFGIDPATLSNAFTQNTYGINDVADQTQYAQLQALQKLSGQQSPLVLDPTKFGQGPTSNINVNTEQFGKYAGEQQKIQDQMKPYETIVSQAMAKKSIVEDYKNRLQQGMNQLQQDPSLQQDPEAMDAAVIKLRQQTYAQDPRMASIVPPNGDIDQAYYQFEVDRGKANAAIQGIQKQNFSGGTIADLMSQPERTAYEAAHPGSLQQAINAAPTNVLDPEAYSRMQDQYTPSDQYIWEHTAHPGSGPFGIAGTPLGALAAITHPQIAGGYVASNAFARLRDSMGKKK